MSNRRIYDDEPWGGESAIAAMEDQIPHESIFKKDPKDVRIISLERKINRLVKEKKVLNTIIKSLKN